MTATSPTPAPTPTPTAAPAAGTAPAAAPPPRLAAGVDLMGEYEGSGFKHPHYMARRGDGQVVQLSELLHAIARECDGRRDLAEIAALVRRATGRPVSPGNVARLLDRRLRPLGIVASAQGTSPPMRRLDPMLALRFRTAVIPSWAVRVISGSLRPLFFGPVVVAVLAALVGVDIWVFAVHGVAQALRQLLYQPLDMFLLLGLVILSAAFHECGHATACRYSGARPGVMGAGLYLVWPAFYTDVTDAYRLGRGGRLRTDLGGVYFNVVVILATVAVYAFTHFEPLLAVVLIQHIEIVHQLLPFLRLDGYYIIADLTGVPDMFNRIKPVLASLVPWRRADERVRELKTWVRVAVTAWVLLTIPILLYVYGTLVVNFPRIAATAWDSLGHLGHDLGDRASGGAWALVVLDVIQMIALTLPIAGILVSFWRLGDRLGRAAWRRTAERPAARVGVAFAGLGLAAFGAAALLPQHGAYSPIDPREQGTLSAAAASLSVPVTGQPLFNTGSGATPPAVSPGQPAAAPGLPGASPSPGASAAPLPSGTALPGGATLPSGGAATGSTATGGPASGSTSATATATGGASPTPQAAGNSTSTTASSTTTSSSPAPSSTPAPSPTPQASATP